MRSRTWVASVSKHSGFATRPAHLGDLQSLSDIEDRAFERGYSIVVMRQLLELFPQLFFVGTHEGSVRGYVVGGLQQGGEEAWLLSLAVAPEARGKGMATALVDALIGALGDTPAKWLRLTVDPSREDAVAFYRHRDFDDVGFEEGYFGAGKPRLVLGRRL